MRTPHGFQSGLALTASLLLLFASCDDCRGRPVDSLTTLEPVDVLDAGEPEVEHLAMSTSTAPYVPRYPELVIGTTAITLDGRQVVEVSRGAVPESAIRGGGKGMVVTPVLEALGSLGQGAAAVKRVLTISPDPRTPYDLFARVLYTAGEAGVASFQFPVRGTDGLKHALGTVAELPGPPPARPGTTGDAGPGGGSGDAGSVMAPAWGLTVVVTGEGFRVAAPEPVLGSDAGTIAAIPLASGWEARCSMSALADREGLGPPVCAYDFEALRRLLEPIKRRYPTERTIMVGASGDVDWETMVGVLDVARGSAGAELFPVTIFTFLGR
jgi:biopolymer transport protein ExbD